MQEVRRKQTTSSLTPKVSILQTQWAPSSYPSQFAWLKQGVTFLYLCLELNKVKLLILVISYQYQEFFMAV